MNFKNTCDVPQLQSDRLLVPAENFERKIHPDRGPVVGAEVVVHVALDDAGLANPQVPNHKDLIQMFLLVAAVHGERGAGELSMKTPERRGAGADGEQEKDAAEVWEGAEVRPGPSWGRGKRMGAL